MLILDATTKSLQLVLGAAVTTNQLPVSASYCDGTTTSYTPINNEATTNSLTPVTIVAAPAASTQRAVKNITIYNADTASATVTVSLNISSTLYNQIVATLAAGDTLIYEDAKGWYALNSTGSLKTNSFFQSAGGDLSGLYPNPTVATVGGATAANIATATSTTLAATSSANTASTLVLRDGSSKIFTTGHSCNDGVLQRFIPNINTQSGTTYTLNATDNGGVVRFTSNSAITLTVPSGLVVGYNVLIVQVGTGFITWSGSGATVYSLQGYVKSAGQYSILTFYQDSTNVFIVGGMGQ